MTDAQDESRLEQYVDIRELHPEFDHRVCPCCDAEWFYKHGVASGVYCPYCESRPLFRRLGEKYAPHYHEAMQNDDSEIMPPPYHHAIPKAMAYEASEELGFAVNHMHCMKWIWWALPDGVEHSRSEEPGETRKPHQSNIIRRPTEASADV